LSPLRRAAAGRRWVGGITRDGGEVRGLFEAL
jgi:hypothetical protein